MRVRLGLLGVAAAIGVLAFAAAAQSGQIFGEKFHEEDEFPEEDFCGVEGLDVTWQVTRDGHAHVVSRGRDKLPYFGVTFRATEIVTNDDNDNFVIARTTIADKDLRVTDNNDGTFTLLVLSTGNATLYDEDGNVLARNPGQVRFEILIDNAGTPTDPFDDTFISFLQLVKGSTGRTDDFCEAALPELLGP